MASQVVLLDKYLFEDVCYSRKTDRQREDEWWENCSQLAKADEKYQKAYFQGEDKGLVHFGYFRSSYLPLVLCSSRSGMWIIRSYQVSVDCLDLPSVVGTKK